MDWRRVYSDSKTRTILATLLFIILVLIVFLPLSLNNNYYFQNKPVYLNLHVEKPLLMQDAIALSELAVDAITISFDYDISIGSTDSFLDDGIGEYDGDLPGSRNELRFGAFYSGKVNIDVYFFKGNGSEIVNSDDEVVNAAGRSNYGNTIELYFNDTTDILKLETGYEVRDKLRTYVHEIGHAIGLHHNTESPIMFTSEKKDNPDGDERPNMNINWSNEHMQFTTHTYSSVDTIIDNYLLPSLNNSVENMYFKTSYHLEENYTLYAFNDTHFKNRLNRTYYHAIYFNDDTSEYYLMKIKGDILWLTSMVDSNDTAILSKYHVNMSYVDLTGIKDCWTESEIDYCE